jgi:hypothetical protein
MLDTPRSQRSIYSLRSGQILALQETLR